ncbi:YcaO-like family protein [Balneatrix alpica]|uniref:YcaO-like family protein n=1 Tax=Balneatrix alpica TaxID=75684 RepID=A0ABV5Z808_9GAMM|nr:YcaO-like family protein [Balneatrix alpica]
MTAVDYRPSSYTLLETLDKMRHLLRQRGFLLEEEDWLNPLPHVWSVQLREKHCPYLISNGKGVSREAALVSAYGEFIERLSCNSFFNGLYLSARFQEEAFAYYPQERWFAIEGPEWPRGLLDGPTLAHYNLNQDLFPEDLLDTGTANRVRGICALPFIRQRNHQTVWFPVNIISNLYGGNGMGVGVGKYEARVQALSEIFERHIKTTIISDGISLPRVPDEVLARYPQAQATLKALEAAGFVVEVQDASMNGKFPLINVTVVSPQSGGVFACFGAHPRFGVALERALTELMQGRSLPQLFDLPEASFDLARIAEQANISAHFSKFTGRVAWDLLSDRSDYPFVDWDHPGTAQQQFAWMCELIHKVDMDIYIADYEFMGLPACRIIVPGMSDVQPVAKLLRSNDNRAAGLRSALLNLPKLSEQQWRELLEGLDDLELSPQLRIAELIGLVADKGSVWHSLCVAEVQTLVYLALGEREQALPCLRQLLQLPPAMERAGFYRCLHVLLQLALDDERKITDFERILVRTYGQQQVSLCLQVLDACGTFPGIEAAGLELEGFRLHQSLLEAYDKLHKAKAAHHFAIR